MTFQQFIGQRARLGSNAYDPGECVGLVNAYIRDVLNIPLYPIQGVIYAKNFDLGRNTRPDVFEWVPNDPNNESQLPSVGDILVFGGGFPLDWRGHTGVVVEVSSSSIKLFEQYQGTPSGIVTRYWTQDVKGWFHIKTPQQGGDMTETVRAWYRKWLRREGSDGDVAWHAQNTKTEFSFAEGARVELHQTIDGLFLQKEELQRALLNEQQKPPREVIKEVEKIVEKMVEVQVPVEVIKEVRVEVEPVWLVKLKQLLRNLIRRK